MKDFDLEERLQESASNTSGVCKLSWTVLSRYRLLSVKVEIKTVHQIPFRAFISRLISWRYTLNPFWNRLTDKNVANFASHDKLTLTLYRIFFTNERALFSPTKSVFEQTWFSQEKRNHQNSEKNWFSSFLSDLHYLEDLWNPSQSLFQT